eukprot:5212395-Lingulodinium_polyedra.AAC.1
MRSARAAATGQGKGSRARGGSSRTAPRLARRVRGSSAHPSPASGRWKATAETTLRSSALEWPS